MKTKKRKFYDAWDAIWPPLLMLVVLLVVWEGVVRLFNVPLVIMPAPSKVFQETTKYFVSELLEDWLTTVKIIGMGYLAGVPCGILLASLLSQSKLLVKAFSSLIILMVTLPMMVIVPVYMVWVGYEVNYRAILSFVQVTAILTLNTLSGFQNVDQSKLDLAKGYGASRFQTFFKVIFPNALPEVFQGLRLGCTFSILNVIGIEFIAGKVGMGFSVQYFCGLLKTPIVWGCVLIVGITGRLMFMLVQILERHVVTWKR